ncbi:MAG: hypothetical protein A2W28_07325 [Gammaproteobacteria bacterium RBG_16_51_14]|nr:MAG: hypothetical protein A2W28_07325 [Gammaproteobacteria bacterium RBG_16_51_14]
MNECSDKINNIVILGGGLAGLSASYHCGAPVYEAADHYGGIAASDRVDGFLFDRGIHVLQTQNHKLVDLLTELGVDFAIRERHAHIFAHNRYTAFPFQINSTGLPLAKRFHCVWHYLQRDKNPPPTNYHEWMYKTIGKGFADTFLIPYSIKFWGVHPREMTYEWTGNKVPKSSTRQVLRGAVFSRNTKVGSNAIFRYPNGQHGYGALAKVLSDQVRDRLYLDYRASQIDVAEQKIIFENGKEVSYRVLLNTIPLPELARITRGMPAEITGAISKLRTNSILVVNLGINRPNLTDKHWIHFPEHDISFFRISFPHNFSPDMAPPGTSSVSAEVSYSLDNPPDREAITERVIADLKRTRVLKADDKIIARSTYDIRYGYCIYDEHRRASLPLIKDWLKSVNIVPGGRYGLWTYFWSDEAIMSGKKAANQAQKHLAKLQT